MPFGYAGLRKLPKPPSKICHKRKSAVHRHCAKLGTSGASSHSRAAMRLLLAVMNHNRVANRPFKSRRETTSLEPIVLSVDMTPTRSPDVPPEGKPAIRVVRRDISREDAQRMHPSLVTCGCKSQTSAATMIASKYQRAWTTMTQGQQRSSDGFPIQAVTLMQ